MFENPLEQQRINKAQTFKELGENPYPHYIYRDMTSKEFLQKYSYVSQNDPKEDKSVKVSLAGRIKFLRHMGKAAFAKIEDADGRVQIYFNKDGIGAEWFAQVKKLIDVGDIINVQGYPFVTKTGELSLHVNHLSLATKAIVPLPEKFHGLQDKELRYRQRYLDMIMNPEVKDDFKLRSQVVSILRRFFEDYGFLEVETPMLHPIAGGANAKPFITHHNALGVERYLRIAPELYLKRLVVGGFEAVFEINRNFRNEGMDYTHNPEFTMLEFYWAYHTYEDLMDLTEKLFATLLEKLNLPKILEFEEHKIDFSKPFRRIAYRDALIEIGNVDEKILDDKDAIVQKLQKDGFKINPNLSLGHLHAELFDAYVEEKLINPTFVTHFPIAISPLSRRSDKNPDIAERFELFIAGREIANGFNELNDPLDQYQRFCAQLEAKDAGDDEAHEMDEDYVKALGYGMPPTAGQGLGIDRLVMLLANRHSIRDVILFPAMKPITKNENTEGNDQ
jgi:lysyl-tRNA synthetase class 2